MRKATALVHTARQRVRAEAAQVRGRLSTHFWSVPLAIVAAMVAWTLAGGLVQDHRPFFAPIAAVIALNASGGERGTNAVRLLTGVVLGILVGEFATTITGEAYWAIILAVGTAMSVAIAAGASRTVVGQAAVSAVLTVVFGGDAPGFDRLIDALIGAGVALVFSQLLFPARLVALMRRIEVDALAEMAHMLDLTGRTLREGHDASSRQMVNRLGDLSRPMAELSRARESSRLTVRRSTIRWGDPAPVLDEDEIIDRLILLGESCLFLARTTASMGAEERQELAPIVCGMGEVLETLSSDLSSREARRQAVDQALRSARLFGEAAPDDDPVTHATHLAVEMVATDIMVFAGIRFEDAEEALQDEERDPHVPSPSGVPLLPWVSWHPNWERIRARRFPRRR